IDPPPPPSPTRRSSDLHRHVKNRSARHADQLALRAGLLKMQATQDSPLRAGMVVLHERQINSRLAIAFDLERLQKKSAMVPKHPGLDDQHPGKLRFNNLQNILLRMDDCHLYLSALLAESPSSLTIHPADGLTNNRRKYWPYP